MNGFKSIGAQLNIRYVACITIILAVFGVYNYSQLKAEKTIELEEQAVSTLERLTLSLPEPIWNFDEVSLSRIIESEMRSQAVSSIIIDSNEGVLTGRGRDATGKVVENMVVPVDASFSRTQDLYYGSGNDETRIGQATVFMSDHLVKEALATELMKVVIQIIILDALIVIFQTYILSRIVIKPLDKIVDAVRDISEGEGDLRQRLDIDREDELGELAKWFNQFLEGIQNLVSQVINCSEQVTESSQITQEIASSCCNELESQQGEIGALATAVTEMSATAQEVAKSAEQAADETRNASEESNKGKQVVIETVDAIDGLASEVQTAGEVIHQLEANSDNIGTILDVIRGIAEQTNLLALNAAIEAARAGEQGRGFAVVADEVRTLAQRTQQSTEEIQTMIERLQEGSKRAVEVMRNAREGADGSVQQAARAGDSLEEIAKAVSSIADMNTQIASAAEEQNAVTVEIDKNIVGISSVIDSIVGKTRQSVHDSEQLTELSHELNKLVSRFKV
jgi:methyl-accepting chemotaxis protein